MSKPTVTTLARSATVLLPLAFFLQVGDRGIDFGRHWDEPLLVADVKAALDTRLLLPTRTANYPTPGLAGGHYEYPSVLYWIGLATTMPRVLAGGLDPAVPMSTAFVDTPLFAIRLRQACLAVTSLSIVWTFALGWRVAGRWWAGLVAATLLATSWEVGYHARFVAPDGILMQFAALCLWLCVEAVCRRSRRLLFAAAIAAGLATGTKYPGALFVLPVLTAAVLTRPWRRLFVDAPLLVATVVTTFVVTTPGAVLQPWNVAAWVRLDRRHYGVDGHFGHTIRNPVAHALAMAEYLSTVLFSRYRPVAVGAVVFAGIGVAARRRRGTVILLLPAAAYFAVFAGQVVMLVRNLLVFAPVLAVFAAAGVAVTHDRLGRVGRGVLVATVLACVAANVAWAEWAAGPMEPRRAARWQVDRATAYLAAHPGLRVFPSDGVAAATGLPTVPPPSAGRAVVLAFAHEDGDVWRWPANVPGLTIETFGPTPCNFDYYPNWVDDRLVLMDLDEARRVPVGQVERAVRRHDVAAALPPGQTLVAYLNCGSAPAVADHGVTIRATAGTAYGCQSDVAVPQPDAVEIQADPREVRFEIARLDPAATYAVGWSWWDWNAGHRTQSAAVRVGDSAVQLCGPTPLPPWPLAADPVPHGYSVLWPPRAVPIAGVAPIRAAAPVPPAAYRSGTCSVVVRREAGPDVVVTGLWVVRTGQPASSGTTATR